MREYVLTLFIAAAVTYLLTPLARRLAILTGAMTRVRERDVHVIPTPRLGGLAMYAGLCAAVLVASRLPILQRAFHASNATTAVLSAGAVIVALGAVDDRWGLDALTKLAGQVVAAGLLVLQGVQLYYIPLPHTTLSLGPNVAVPVTVLLVLLTVNAVNFIDGLDGLAAGVVGIAALSFFAFSYQLSVTHGFDLAAPPTLISAMLAGVCLGFLPHNFNPARVFMGDSGSMLIGLLLASTTITLTGQLDYSFLRSSEVFPVVLPVVLPIAVLAVPFIDLILAILRRVLSGRSPMSPDKAHLHHRLVEMGHSHRRAVLLMYFWAALLAFGAVGSALTGAAPYIVVPAVALVVTALAVSIVPRYRPPPPPVTIPPQEERQPVS